jgi:metal-responsive CopG/Arc/MetJ family transcriptional regulator
MKGSRSTSGRFERMISTLPRPLAEELVEYARVLKGGNKSGFVADAIRSYIEHYRRLRHTALLRRSYAAAAKKSQAVAHEWETLDDATWARLDELEARSKTR